MFRDAAGRAALVAGADNSPQEVEVLESLPWVGDLKLARVRRDETSEVEAPQRLGVSGVTGHCREVTAGSHTSQGGVNGSHGRATETRLTDVRDGLCTIYMLRSS